LEIPYGDIFGMEVCLSAIGKIDEFLDKYFPNTKRNFEVIQEISDEYYRYYQTLRVKWNANWPFKVARLPHMKKFILNRIRTLQLMSLTKDYFIKNPKGNIQEILKASKYRSITGKNFDFDTDALRFFKTELIREHFQKKHIGRYYQYVLGRTSGKAFHGLSSGGIWMVDYCNRHDIDKWDHPKLEEMVEVMPDGLGTEIPETYHSYLTDVAGDPNYSFENKIRVWNARSDVFTLRYDRATNTLEIADFKPELDFNSDYPNNHFINAIMQVLIYSLIVQDEVRGEVKIRCLIFNKKGFIQFEPNSMYFELLNFLTNLKGSEWHHHIQANVMGSNNQEIKDAYEMDYKTIMPTVNTMKFFIDFYQLVDSTKIAHQFPLELYSLYLKMVELEILEMREIVQDNYLKSL
jgi:hypothetical protein